MMCLMADAECVTSVIDPRSDKDKEKTPPFLKAVDVDLATGLEDVEPSYTGQFKVSIAALAMEFYLALHEFPDPSELRRSQTLYGRTVFEIPAKNV